MTEKKKPRPFEQAVPPGWPATRLKQLDAEKPETRIERNGGFDLVHEYASALARGGRPDLAEQELADLYAAMESEKALGNPTPGKARKLTASERLAWRVTIELDNVYMKWLNGRQRAPKQAYPGEANNRLTGWYATACENLGVDPDTELEIATKRNPNRTVSLQDAVEARWKQGRPVINKMRRRFEAEAKNVIPGSTHP